MSTIQNFEDLKVWQKARMLCKQIYEIIQGEKFAKDFKLRDQINGSSGSIMDNIAEGYGRAGNLEFINFLSIANGSCMETKSQLYRALDRNYISSIKCEELIQITIEISKMIYALMSYLGKANMKGLKFKIRACTP
jgi:four helix bundle protein